MTCEANQTSTTPIAPQSSQRHCKTSEMVISVTILLFCIPVTSHQLLYEYLLMMATQFKRRKHDRRLSASEGPNYLKYISKPESKLRSKLAESNSVHYWRVFKEIITVKSFRFRGSVTKQSILNILQFVWRRNSRIYLV